MDIKNKKKENLKRVYLQIQKKKKQKKTVQENSRDTNGLFYRAGENTSSVLHAFLSKHFKHVNNLWQTTKQWCKTPKAAIPIHISHADGTDQNNTLGYREKQNPANDESWSSMNRGISRFTVNNHEW